MSIPEPNAFFPLVNGELHAEDVPLARIAEMHGTPCYVYSRAALTAAFNSFDRAFAGRDHLICYAVKANANLAVLNLFARLGAGFDIVSGGELARVLAAGGDPGRVVFSGVGKSDAEMAAALEAGIRCFNVESAGEIDRLERVAAGLGRIAPVSLRVNPDVDPNTHPYISTGLKCSKFGVAHTDALRLYERVAASARLQPVGIDCHIGSQITEVTPFVDALRKVLELVDALAARGIALHHIDLGGGVGIRYADETPPAVPDYAAAILNELTGRPQQLLLEPGRALVGNAGVLLTRVTGLKPGDGKHFAIVDAAMNDLMRPALYDAWHAIQPVQPHSDAGRPWDVVGPVCESGDFLGLDRSLALAEGDLLAILSAGAYGMSMSSNYNTRPRAAEVLVDGATAHLARRRETLDDLMRGESILPG